jgi:hypothetical protein
MGTLRGIRRLVRLTAVALVVGAVATELAKPEEERNWHGRVLGVVPYDFRAPSWDKIRDAYWNSSSDRLFSDRVFGVGWAINLHRAKTLLAAGFERLMGTPPPLALRMTSRREAERAKMGVQDRD